MRVRASVSKPKYGWGEVNHTSIGTVRIVRVEPPELKVDFPKQKGWSGMIKEMEVVGGITTTTTTTTTVATTTVATKTTSTASPTLSIYK